MNERIKELAKQAGQGEPFHIPPQFIETFAELIIKECVKRIVDDVIVFTKNDLETKTLCAEAILEHFGVN